MKTMINPDNNLESVALRTPRKLKKRIVKMLGAPWKHYYIIKSVYNRWPNDSHSVNFGKKYTWVAVVNQKITPQHKRKFNG